MTLSYLIGAMFLALIALPLFFVFLPLAVGCVAASLLLVMLALPDLVADDQQMASRSLMPGERPS